MSNMKHWIALVLFSFALPLFAQDAAKPANLKGVLLMELRETHNDKQWFVPANVAVAGLTAEQASWKDGKGNHSVGQLAYHLVFWNTRALAQLKKEQVSKFSGNNEETFDNFNAKQWDDIVKQLDQVLTDCEKAVESADDATLAKWAPTIARISMHNAYHIGEIVVVRKEQGSWNPDNGVK